MGAIQFLPFARGGGIGKEQKEAIRKEQRQATWKKQRLAMRRVEELAESNWIILLLGNPGVGKSSLGNALAGEYVFPSGITVGKALTHEMNSHTCKVGPFSGKTIIDLPGLDDPDCRADMAAEVSKALKFVCGWKCKVVFVCTQEAGRVRPADRTTMRLILEAAPEIAGNYGVIYNKCQPRFKTMMADEKFKFEFRNIMLRGLPVQTDVENLFFAEDYKAWKDLKEEAVPPMLPGLDTFIESLPSFELTESKINLVFTLDFDALTKEHQVTREESAIIKEAEAEAKEKQQKEAELRQLRFWLAVTSLPLVSVALYPAIATAFDFHEWGSWAICTLTVFGQKKIELMWGMFPYYVLMTCAKCLSVLSAWTSRSSIRPSDSYKMCGGKTVQSPCSSKAVKVWQIWLVEQAYDAATDVKTMLAIWSSSPEVWLPYMWAVTVFFSITVPVGFAGGCVLYPKALLFECVLEDVGQALMSVVMLLSWDDDIIPCPVLFSTVFSVLGVVELLGKMTHWLAPEEADYDALV